MNITFFHLKALEVERKRFARRWYDTFCSCLSDAWEKRSILITRYGIIEMNQRNQEDFLIFDAYFKYFTGMYHTENQYGVLLVSMHRKLLIRANNLKDFLVFMYYLKEGLNQAKINQIKYKASSPTRNVNSASFIIDAENYFKKVVEVLESATRQVFICGWWISPQLPLIRPYNSQTHQYRLDNLLKKIAEKGVNIFILVFQNPPVVPNNYAHTVQTFHNLHPNIHILSHPKDIIPIFQSHHEKAVIVDQRVALMGGLDLAYGRFDNSDHSISSNSKEMYPGIEYNNNRIKDFNEVQKYQKDALPRDKPRLPWHDVALCVTGEVVTDLANHFSEYWNNTYLETIFIKEKAPPKVNKKFFDQSTSNELAQNQYQNIKISKIFSIKIPKINNYLEQIRNYQMSENPQVNHLADKTLSVLPDNLNILKLREQEWQQKKRENPDDCQLLRSASEWSIGLETESSEKSIYNAYIELIKESKHFIYIENQFFISATGDQDSYVQNGIANALFERIKMAIEKKEKFRVIVLMPLLPGMEGDIKNDPPMTLQLVIHWQYQTIYRTEKSLICRIAKLTPHPEEYIQFFGLRQHGVLENKPVTQIIYIHTKLMIIDDRIAICGSANINDRSMEGNRDSQLCLLVSGGEIIQSDMGGQPFMVSKKVSQLRKMLFHEHFNLPLHEVKDPIQPNLVKDIRVRTKTNTETYRQLFGCYPDDKIKKISQASIFAKNPSIHEYQQHSPNITSHAVEFPFKFLEEEDLTGLDLDLIHDVMV